MRFLRIFVFACLVFAYCSCKKNSDAIDFSPSFYILNGDTTSLSFNNTLILFSSADTIRYNVIVSSTYLLSANGHITVAVDDNARTVYNSNHSTNFQAMPSNAYIFPTTIADTTSSVYDTIPVIIYKHALDVTQSYMLSISIIDADGVAITADASTIYLHTVNNKLSGIYNAIGTKIMYDGDAADSIINSIDTFSLTKNLIPVNSSSSQLDYADLGSNGWKYNLALVDAGEILITPNDVILSSVESGSFKILSSSYDAETKDIYIKSSYYNTSGNERIVEETLQLQ